MAKKVKYIPLCAEEMFGRGKAVEVYANCYNYVDEWKLLMMLGFEVKDEDEEDLLAKVAELENELDATKKKLYSAECALMTSETLENQTSGSAKIPDDIMEEILNE